MPDVRPDLPQLPPGFRFGTSAAAYHLLDEDVALLKDLGVGAHRFPLAWRRLQPAGAGPLDGRTADRYDRLLDALVAAGVRPTVTLHDGDLPQPLEADGGWLNRTTIDRFAEYAALAADRFGDRVEHWIPVDQPNVAMLAGQGTAIPSSARALVFDVLPVAHHLLLAHGRAAIAVRGAAPAGTSVSVGCANNHAPMWPASDDAADVGATKLFDAFWNGLFLEPMLLGRYPVDLTPLLEDVVRDGDLATIRQPLDFYGVTYDHPMRVGAAPEDAEVPFERRELLGHATTDLGWPVVPEALREWLITFRARFRAALPPIHVTENGAAYDVGPDADGVVDDQARIDYLAAHLRAVGEAAQRGVDVRAYYCRTLLDGPRRAEDRLQRFGLVHVDPETQARTPKRSFRWYADVIAAQTRSLG